MAATNPAPNAIVALPQGTISVTFDQDMVERIGDLFQNQQGLDAHF
ncbi:hypothetical protein [Nostoc sp. CHAB 5715]|nr:hypothetical protein [Nostoc sp. CHAB 5715]